MEGVKNNIVSSVGEAFQSVGQFIMDGLTALFVPDEDFIMGKVETVREKFSFIESVKTAWETIASLVMSADEEIPKIEIDLSKAEGQYNYGGKVLALDMTWYSRYKPTVDAIIIAFSYIGFVFLVVKRMPEIISGSGAITERADDMERGYRKKR